MKTPRRKLTIGSNEINAVCYREKGTVANNMDDILKTTEKCYTYLDACDTDAKNSFRIAGRTAGQAPSVPTDELEIAFKAMKKGEAAGIDEITGDVLYCGEDIVVNIFRELFS